jgi:hypothetical protein
MPDLRRIFRGALKRTARSWSGEKEGLLDLSVLASAFACLKKILKSISNSLAVGGSKSSKALSVTLSRSLPLTNITDYPWRSRASCRMPVGILPQGR